MRVAICDDEPMFIMHLRDQICGYSVQRKTYSVEVETFDTLEALQPYADTFDVIFLDIRFNGQTTGIEWAKGLRRAGNQSFIVMCSFLEDQAVNAFHAEAVRFLVKPVTREAVFEALDFCAGKLAKNDKPILVKSDFEEVLIYMSQILYVKSVRRHRVIVLTVGTEISTNETLRSIYDKLDRTQFGYTDRSYIVQYRKVEKTQKQKAWLVNGEQIPISRPMLASFKNALAKWVEEQI